MTSRPAMVAGLAAIPLALGAVIYTIGNLIQPYFAGLSQYDYDAAYVYLFNGLSVVQGYVPGHIDHPGTPMQAFCGAVSFFAWIVGRASGSTSLGFNESVVADPEHYLAAISVVLAVMNTAAIYYLGLRVFLTAKNIFLALVVEIGFGLLGMLMPRLVYVSPEALIAFSSIMLMACLCDSLFSGEPGTRTGALNAIFCGIFAAIGITAKVTFLPLVLLLLLLPTARLRLLSALAFVVFLAVCLFPIRSELPRVFQWMSSIAEHSGSYGNGPRNVIDLSASWTNLQTLNAQAPLVFIAIAINIAAIVVQVAAYLVLKIHRPRAIWNGVVLLVVLVAQVGLVVKHIGIHYIIPSEIISPMVIAWSIWTICIALLNQSGRSVIAAIAAMAMLVISAHELIRFVQDLSRAQVVRNDQLAAMDAIWRAHPAAITVGTYRVPSQAYAVNFGLGYVNSEFAQKIARDSISYNRWNNQLYVIGDHPGWQPLTYLNSLVTNGRKVFLVLPPDVSLPQVAGKTLLEIPGQERVIEVEKVNS